MLAVMFAGCGPTVRLTASWHDPSQPPVRFSKILVLAIGKDLGKRTLAENAIAGELQRQGFEAQGSIVELGPAFGQNNDSVMMRSTMLEHGFDGALTVRVLSIDEHDRWVPGTTYYGPMGFYRGFYGYYRRVWGYYATPGYQVMEVEVLLESNLYRTATGDLLWTGQSKAFSRNPTPESAARYARYIVKDLIAKGAIRR